jgi:hypothetical protein
MAKANKSDHPAEHSERLPYRVRLPGFIAEREVGLGDAVKRATSYVGIKSCGGCEGRANALNRRLVFSPWRGR